MQTPNPLSKELAPHEAPELDDGFDPDELDELEDPELDVVEEEVEVDPEEAEDDEEDDDELEVEVVEVVDAVDDVEVVVCWVEVATGVSLQGLLGKAIYEGIPDGIAGT